MVKSESAVVVFCLTCIVFNVVYRTVLYNMTKNLRRLLNVYGHVLPRRSNTAPGDGEVCSSIESLLWLLHV